MPFPATESLPPADIEGQFRKFLDQRTRIVEPGHFTEPIIELGSGSYSVVIGKQPLEDWLRRNDPSRPEFDGPPPQPDVFPFGNGAVFVQGQAVFELTSESPEKVQFKFNAVENLGKIGETFASETEARAAGANYVVWDGRAYRVSGPLQENIDVIVNGSTIKLDLGPGVVEVIAEDESGQSKRLISVVPDTSGDEHSSPPQEQQDKEDLGYPPPPLPTPTGQTS